MFIEISPLRGVFESSYPYNNKINTKVKDFTENYRLNLNCVRKVFFEDDLDLDLEINDDYGYGTIIVKNLITFEVITSGEGDNDEITLYFTKKGEGEYQRIKRIIDENTLR
jgi:hypothetical protein